MDVKNTLLNEDLKEKFYMVPTPGVSHNLGKVCKLQKALYGLKQASWAWFERFSNMVTSLGYYSNAHD